MATGTLNLVTLCDAIHDLYVPNLSILDVDEIPVGPLRTPVLFPEPVEFLTDFTVTRVSYGSGDTALTDVDYDLTYTFAFTPIGAGRTGIDLYGAMVGMYAEIIDKILDIATIDGAITLEPNNTTSFGPVPDPAGNMYLGCKLVLHVHDFWR